MEADLVNLKSIGAPFSILIVDVERGNDLYRRGKRVIRTFSELYGSSNFICLDKSQLEKLLNENWEYSTNKSKHLSKKSEGVGGEKNWATKIRRKLAKLGNEIGFIVKEDWLPDDLKYKYKKKRQLWDKIDGETEFDKYTWIPNGERKSFKRWDRFYTRSKLDLVWTIPYPEKLKKFLKLVVELDEDHKTHTSINRTAESLHPFFGFELESSAGKHAAGSIVNLGKYPTVGQIITPDLSICKRIENKIKTYEKTLGIRNVETVVMDNV
ncbi:MAG: hypothetical protein ACOC5T_01345 [Elusimicrobiota bacterium]